MQASGRNLSMPKVAKILYQEEGLLRFWRGAQVMASGCVPAHASYFLAYEHLKLWLNLDNEEFNLSKNLLIGCTTTFAHDFFITPADGKNKSHFPTSLIMCHIVIILTCMSGIPLCICVVIK